MSDGARLYAYQSYEDWVGTKSTLEELARGLRPFSLQTILWCCSYIAASLQLWQRSGWPEEVYLNVVRRFFHTRDIYRMWLGFWSADPRKIAFHRRQIMLIAKLALLNCNSTGVDLRLHTQLLGPSLLKANDHLHYDSLERPDGSHVASTKDDFARLIAEFVAVTEASSLCPDYEMARNSLLLGEFTSRLSTSSDYINASAEYESATGMTASEFNGMIFVALARLGAGKALEIQNGLLAPAIKVADCRLTAIPPIKVDKFFRLLSGTPTVLRRELAKRDVGPNDFTVFRKFPMIEQWFDFHLNSQWIGHLPIDQGFLLNKQLTGPYWHAMIKHKSRFSRFWGGVFELYVSDMLQHVCSETKAHFVANPRHPDDPNRQICDALIIEGGRLIIIEAKGFVFTAEAKYSGDPRSIAQEIDEKLVYDTKDGRKKAVVQLSDAVFYFLSEVEACKRMGIEMESIRTIYPVVVTLDSIGGTIGMSTYLNVDFNELRREWPLARQVTRPLFCLDIRGLEYMTEYAWKDGISGLLERWHSTNPSLGTPFPAIALNDIKGRPNPWLAEKFAAMTASIAKTVFPNEAGG